MGGKYYIFTETQLQILSWTSLAICFIFVVLRLYVRIYLRTGFSWRLSQWWLWSDALVVLSWMFYLAYVISSTIQTVFRYYGPLGPGAEAEEQIRQANVHTNFTLVFVKYIFRVLSIYLVKFSVLCFYNELVSPSRYKLWISIRLIAGFMFAFLIATIAMTIFGCGPPQQQWTPQLNERCDKVITWVMEAWNVSTDFLVYLMPMAFICALENLSRWQKGSVLIMFGLGILSTFASLAALATLSYPYTNIDANRVRALCWSIECPIAILVACCPAFRYIFARVAEETGLTISRTSSRNSDLEKEGPNASRC